MFARDRLVPVPHARGPRAALGRRIAGGRAFGRLSGDRRALRRDAVRRRHGGLAGGYYSIVNLHLWQEQLTSGRGWIALALVVFATWRPGRLLIGALLFGAVTGLQFYAQAIGVPVPTQFLAMLPYVATIVVLVLISRNPNTIRLNAPASLGKPFFAAG